MKASNVTWSALALMMGAVAFVQARPPQAVQSASVAPALEPSDAAAGRALVNKYCVTCHNERLKTAGLTLETTDLSDVAGHAEVWEKVVRKLRSNAMPPPGRPRPDQAAASSFVKYLETAHDQAALAHPNPGRSTVHRLNRSEYVNAIRDLIGLEIDGRAMLVADDIDKDGFDNNAEVLSVSPAAMERFMTAARRISREAIGRQAAAPAVAIYKLPRMLYQDGRMDEDLPFGSRGGLAVKHRFPVDGEYSVKVKLQTNLYDYIRGIGKPHQLELRLDGVRVKLFTVGGEDMGRTAPASFAGAMFGSPEWEDYSHVADKGLEVRFAAKAGPRVLGIAFVGEPALALEGVLRPKQVGYPLAVNEQQDGNPAVDTVFIGGPYSSTGPGDTPPRQKIFLCTPATPNEDSACAEKILSTLARRAYRRPVTGAEK
jgi:mono/diheme cytochrome c family protein